MCFAIYATADSSGFFREQVALALAHGLQSEQLTKPRFDEIVQYLGDYRGPNGSDAHRDWWKKYAKKVTDATSARQFIRNPK
jgi:hypothetical protein